MTTKRFPAKLAGIIFVLLLFPSTRAALLQEGDIVFADSGLDAIIRYNPASRTTNWIASFNFRDSRGGIVLGKNGEIYASRAGVRFTQFYRIDPETGEATLISGEQLIFSAHRIALSPDGASLLTAGTIEYTPGTSANGIFKVDVRTGKQSVITTNFLTEPLYEQLTRLTVGPKGELYVTGLNAGLIRFNADGSGRTLIAYGGLLQYPHDAVVGNNGQIYVADIITKGVVRVNADDGSQTLLTPPGPGTFFFPSDMIMDADGSLIVADAATDVIARVNPATGQTTVLLTGLPGPRSPQIFRSFASAPVLTISRAGQNAVIRWSGSENAWSLQNARDLGALMPWNDLGVIPEKTAEGWQAAVPLNLPASLFRLRRNQP